MTKKPTLEIVGAILVRTILSLEIVLTYWHHKALRCIIHYCSEIDLLICQPLNAILEATENQKLIFQFRIMSTFRPTKKACCPRNHLRCAFLDDIILPKMSYKWVHKFGPCAGMEIRPNCSLSGWPCALAWSITFFCSTLDRVCAQAIAPCFVHRLKRRTFSFCLLRLQITCSPLLLNLWCQYIIFKHSRAMKRSWKIFHGGPGKSCWIFLVRKRLGTLTVVCFFDSSNKFIYNNVI